MKFLLNYITQRQAKPEDLLEKSYRESFMKNVTDEELVALQDHQVLYTKVLDELGGRVKGVEEMSIQFNKCVTNEADELLLSAMEHYVRPDTADITDFNVSLFKPETWSNHLWTYKKQSPVLDVPQKDVSKILNILPLKMQKIKNLYLFGTMHIKRSSVLLSRTYIKY